MTIGRHTNLSSVEAYRKINKKWAPAGVIGVVVSLCVLSFYSVIGGWVLNYIYKYLTGGIAQEASAQYFNSFISGTYTPILWHFIFIFSTCMIVYRGISGGIEKSSEIMMPALFILLIVVAIRSVTLEGAAKGLEFYLKPDFSKVTLGTIVAALGQAFFSLSLGMGAIITYGSYLGKDANLEKDSVIIPILDTFVALLSGFAVLPAVFAFGFEPAAGPSLMFITLPAVFDSMPFGHVFGIIFFVLVFFAALTSAMSLLEVVVSFTIDSFKWKRHNATLIVSLVVFLLGIPCSLSQGPILSEFTIMGLNFFDFMSYLAESVLMPLGGLLMCIFIGYVWGVDNATKEITSDGKYKFYTRRLWSVMIKYIAPVLIFIIWLDSIGVF